MKHFYVWLYFMTIIFHYFGLAGGLVYAAHRIGQLKAFAIWFFLWLLSGIVFNGCIFAHIQNYFLCKAFGQQISYSFFDSLAYKLVFKYLF